MQRVRRTYLRGFADEPLTVKDSPCRTRESWQCGAIRTNDLHWDMVVEEKT